MVYARYKTPDFSIPSWCAGVYQPSSTFWSVTMQPVDGNQHTIRHIKGDIPSCHMRYRRLISIHRLQRYGCHTSLNNFSLVYTLNNVRDSAQPSEQG